MKFQAELVVSGTNGDSVLLSKIPKLPEKVAGEIKKGLKFVPKALKVKENDKIVDVSCVITLDSEVINVLVGPTSIKNASRLQQFFGKMVIDIAKKHED